VDGVRGLRFGSVGAGKVDKTFARSRKVAGQDNKFLFQPSSGQGFQRAMVAAPADDAHNLIWAYRGLSDEAETVVLQADDDSTLESDDGQTLEAELADDNNTVMLVCNAMHKIWGNAELRIDALGRVQTDKTGTDSPRLVAIGSDFRLSTLEGDPLGVEMVFPERSTPNGNRMTVRRAWMMTDAVTAEASLVHRESLVDQVIRTTGRVREDDDSAILDDSGRYLALRLTTEAGDDWSFMLGATVELSDEGQGGSR
jgi:hypothetical protein